MGEFLKELEKRINEIVPTDAAVTGVSLAASEVLIFTTNINLFLTSETLVRSLAKELKKRIHIRSASSVLKDPEGAKEIIERLVPNGAGVEDIQFDAEFNEVVIEAKKPGLVIGKGGSTLKAIARETGWYPNILRVPTSPSPVVKGVRYTLLKESKSRAKILKRVGLNIYRSPVKPTDWIRMTTLGGAREVGRSCILLETPESKILMDCGVNVASSQNSYPLLDSLGFSLDELDAIVISHAHLDHSGFVPYLVKYGFDGPIYCTPPTRDVSTLLQLDYIDVLKKEGRDPPYTQKDVKNTVKHTVTRGYKAVTDISPDIRMTLYNAAHILGSASVHLHMGHGIHNLLYTADFKFGFTNLFNPIQTRFPRLETLIIESTYGSVNDTQPPRHVSDQQLMQEIHETCKAGGSVLIPVFAIGRAQEIMLVLENYANVHGLEIPVYIDGMTKEASAIHTVYPEYLKKNVKKRILHNASPFDSEIFIEVDKAKRDEVAEEKGSIIISPSGMLSGGPSVRYFKSMCENPKNKIIFVGYQGAGSLGKRIQNMGQRRSNNSPRRIPMNVDGKTIGLNMKMQVRTVEGYSGHSDRKQLMGFVNRIAPKPEKAVFVHGDENSCTQFSKAVGFKNPRIEINVPRNLDSIRLR